MRLPTVGIIFFFQFALGQINSVPVAPELHRIYHFKSDKNLTSEYHESDFFIHPNGYNNFELEIQSLIDALNDPSKIFTVDGLPAACLFPARKKVLEKILKINFPQPECKDYLVWKEQLQVTHLSILFAGAYSQNPASLFGHTMMRLSNRNDRIRTSPLLSYVVGFLAQTADDNSFMRIQKGLTGKYPGYFQIEPFYLKLGLYNNSESRDLWEVDLKFSKEEIDLFIDHLWEVSRFAKPYYFIKRNCSYQLLKLLEAVNPELKLTNKINVETLPHETIRMLMEQKIATENYVFYPSLQKKIDQKMNSMTAHQIKKFKEGLLSIDAVQSTKDILILDSLIMHWQLKNYQSNLKLKPMEILLMESTYLRRAQISDVSEDQGQVFLTSGPTPPFLGHRPRLLKIGMNQKVGTFAFRSGVHGFDQSNTGFDDFSAIQYLGADALLDFENPQSSEYDFTVADIRSFENWHSQELKKSWLLKFNFKSKSEFQTANSTTFNSKAGLGLSNSWGLFRLYSLAVVKSETLLKNQSQTLIRIGFLNGFKYEFNKNRILAELDTEFLKHRTRQRPIFQWAYSFNLNSSLLTRYEPLFVNDRMNATLSFEHNF